MANISAGGSAIGLGCARNICAILTAGIMSALTGGAAKGLGFDE